MRVAVVTNILPPFGRGGAEAYAAATASSLAARHEVEVFTGVDEGDVAAPVVALPHLGDLPSDAPLRTKLLWHARDQWRPSVHLALARKLRAFAPDVVHSHAIQGLSAGVFTAIAQVGAPHVHTAHDLSLLCMRTSMTRDLEFCGGGCATCRVQRRIRGAAFRRHLTRLLAVSEYIRRRHVEYGAVRPEHAAVLRLGSDADSAAPRVGRRDGIIVGFIGVLAPHKGIPTLLDVFRNAPPGWRLHIAGSGPLQESVEQAAATHPQISYFGHVSGEAKESFFGGIDVLAIPSEWEEPAALVGTEAAARGVPTVVSDRGGIPELPEARVFRARDASSLRSAIGWFTEEQSRLEEISLRLIQRHDEFSWQTHMRGLERELTAAAGQTISA